MDKICKALLNFINKTNNRYLRYFKMKNKKTHWNKTLFFVNLFIILTPICYIVLISTSSLFGWFIYHHQVTSRYLRKGKAIWFWSIHKDVLRNDGCCIGVLSQRIQLNFVLNLHHFKGKMKNNYRNPSKYSIQRAARIRSVRPCES